MPTKPTGERQPPADEPIELKILKLRRCHAELMVEIFREEEHLAELKARRTSVEADLKILTRSDNPYGT